MKTDRKLLAAVILLIGLMVWLIVLSMGRNDELNRALKSIEEIRSTTQVPQVIRGIDGKTPVLGIDYFNGRDGRDGNDGRDGVSQKGAPGLSAYEIAIKNGYVGTEKQWLASLKGDKGDTGRDVDIQCIGNNVVKKFTDDDLWQVTNIKCEAENE